MTQQHKKVHFGKLEFFVWNETIEICSNTYFTTFLSILVFIHHCTRIVTIKLFFVNLIWKLSICHLTLVKSGINGKCQTDLINRAIDLFDWINLFLDKNFNEKVILFNWAMLKTIHHFIPNKTILCGEKAPPWMNDRIKHLIKKKKSV